MAWWGRRAWSAGPPSDLATGIAGEPLSGLVSDSRIANGRRSWSTSGSRSTMPHSEFFPRNPTNGPVWLYFPDDVVDLSQKFLAWLKRR